MIDENTSCLDDQVENMPSKQIDEIIPLINETSFHQTNLIQPAVSNTKFRQTFLVHFDPEFIHE